MKIQSVFSRLPKLFFTLALIVFLSSCSSYTQQVDSNNNKQMGELIQSRLSNQTELSESQIAKAIYSLATAKGSNELSAEQINTTVKLYREGLISTVVNKSFSIKLHSCVYLLSSYFY